jgi:hypothetical protein
LDEGIVQYLHVQQRIRFGRKYLSIPSYVQEAICSNPRCLSSAWINTQFSSSCGSRRHPMEMVAVWTITLSAVLAGALDISATGLVRRIEGVPFRRLLQFVASGMMGTAAFEGGANTAAIGLALHFLIAAIWAALYFSAANSWPVLMREPVLCGVLYGCTVHLVMSRVVVPLSRAAKRPFSWKGWLPQLVIHIVCVGLPIALLQSSRLTSGNIRP